MRLLSGGCFWAAVLTDFAVYRLEVEKKERMELRNYRVNTAKGERNVPLALVILKAFLPWIDSVVCFMVFFFFFT